MQRRMVWRVVFLAGLFTLALPAHGHHSFAAFYDASRVADVEGRVESVRWSNPHVSIEMTQANDGVDERWTIEGDSINALQRKGVHVDSVKVGDRLRVQGALSRHGRPEIFAAVLYLQDGREVVLADRIAVLLKIKTQPLSTGERITETGGARSLEERRNGLFRVWSRNAIEGYPRPEKALRFTPEALAARAAWDPLTDDTGLRCIPQGMPGVIANPYPIEFVASGEEIVLRIEEWDTERTIHMARNSAVDVAATALGYSVGHWEEATLVVRTTRIGWPYYDDVGTPQTEAMEVEERFTLADNGSRLEYVQTAFDPSSFTEPAVLKGYFWLEAGAEIKPFNCQFAH